MVWADLRGRYAHGAGSKLPQCVARIRAGGTSPTGELPVLRETAATLVVDGRGSWGQIAASKAMRLAVAKARTVGFSVGVVRDCSSAAAMGYYPLLAVTEGMIGLAFTNGPPLIAPTGGTTKLIGNQAHAIGCPADRHYPILFDAATSAMSTSEMDLFHERGEPLPPGVLFAGDGQPTRDPALWVDGLLAPAGGHRGYGLSLMFEILTGVLAGGARFAPDVGYPFVSGEPQGVALFVAAIDPEHSIGFGELTRRGRLPDRAAARFRDRTRGRKDLRTGREELHPGGEEGNGTASRCPPGGWSNSAGSVRSSA